MDKDAFHSDDDEPNGGDDLEDPVRAHARAIRLQRLQASNERMGGGGGGVVGGGGGGAGRLTPSPTPTHLAGARQVMYPILASLDKINSTINRAQIDNNLFALSQRAAAASPGRVDPNNPNDDPRVALGLDTPTVRGATFLPA